MGAHYTQDYVGDMNHIESFKPRKISGRIQRAGNYNDYISRYGKESVSAVAFPKNSLLLYLEYDAKQGFFGEEPIYFTDAGKIQKILDDFKVKSPYGLIGKNIEVLLQFSRIIGIEKVQKKAEAPVG